MSEWISPREAAAILEVSEAAVYRSLVDPAEAAEHWGQGNWRRKPLSRRGDLQVRRERAEQLAAEALEPPGGDEATAPPETPDKARPTDSDGQE